MKQKKISILIVILVCLVSTGIGLAAMWYNKKEDKLVAEAKLLVGKQIALEKLQKNPFQNVHSPVDNSRTWVIYLLSTCEACKHELEFAKQIIEEPSSQIKVVGIMMEEDSVIESFIKEHDIRFPVLVDKNKELARSINLKYFPSNLIVNGGKIEKVMFGAPQEKTKLLEFVK